MKFWTSSMIAVLAACCCVSLTAAPAPANTLRYSVTADLLPTESAPEARGRVQVAVRKLGASDHAFFRLTAAKLDPRTSYTLLALMGDETNYLAITNFTTTPSGRARLVYSRKSHGAHQLPAALAGLADVSAIAIADTNGAIVLSADLHGAESMKFALTSVLANAGTDPFALGCLAVAWQGGAAQFRMFATGQSSEFTFCVNGSPVQTYPADATGYIGVGVFPPTAPSPLKFHEVSLRNAADQVVLQSDVR